VTVSPIPEHDLKSRVGQIDWFHRIDLGDGIVTPGSDDSPAKLSALQLPPLKGKTVLDVGAWDGFFSFAAERAGASRVVAVDGPVWDNRTWGSKAGFELAREALGSRVEDRQLNVYEITPERVGIFDVVLFLGVLYHVEDPILALKRLAAVTGELLVVETAMDFVWTKRPAAAFYPGKELGGDRTNWWGPNASAVIGMLKTAGFSDVELLGKRRLPSKLSHFLYNVGNVAHSRIDAKRHSLRWSYVHTDRAVFHARR
jgi:tRNA (mo5U34)-methyltransferase